MMAALMVVHGNLRFSEKRLIPVTPAPMIPPNGWRKMQMLGISRLTDRPAAIYPGRQQPESQPAVCPGILSDCAVLPAPQPAIRICKPLPRVIAQTIHGGASRYTRQIDPYSWQTGASVEGIARPIPGLWRLSHVVVYDAIRRQVFYAPARQRPACPPSC